MGNCIMTFVSLSSLIFVIAVSAYIKHALAAGQPVCNRILQYRCDCTKGCSALVIKDPIPCTPQCCVDGTTYPGSGQLDSSTYLVSAQLDSSSRFTCSSERSTSPSTVPTDTSPVTTVPVHGCKLVSSDNSTGPGIEINGTISGTVTHRVFNCTK